MLSSENGLSPDLKSFIIYVFPKYKNKLWNSQQNGGFISNNFYLIIGWIMRFSVNRGDLYKKYKVGWSLLFQPSRRAPCWVDYQFSDTKI